jgi:hypothetical protein
MTKREACELLAISPKTLQRRIAKGIYTCTRAGTDQYAELSFTYSDLGLAEPVPVPVPTPEPVIESAPAPTEPTPTPEPAFAPTPLGPLELKAQEDERFAQDYLSGKVGDSAGNRVDGTNPQWPNKGQQSLIGSADMYDNLDHTPTETQPHMQPGLLATNDSTGQPVAEARHSFDKGMSDEAYEQAMRDWRRRHGRAPSMAQQREAIERSKAAINEAFNFARRQR